MHNLNEGVHQNTGGITTRFHFQHQISLGDTKVKEPYKKIILKKFPLSFRISVAKYALSGNINLKAEKF